MGSVQPCRCRCEKEQAGINRINMPVEIQINHVVDSPDEVLHPGNHPTVEASGGRLAKLGDKTQAQANIATEVALPRWSTAQDRHLTATPSGASTQFAAALQLMNLQASEKEGPTELKDPRVRAMPEAMSAARASPKPGATQPQNQRVPPQQKLPPEAPPLMLREGTNASSPPNTSRWASLRENCPKADMIQIVQNIADGVASNKDMQNPLAQTSVDMDVEIADMRPSNYDGDTMSKRWQASMAQNDGGSMAQYNSDASQPVSSWFHADLVSKYRVALALHSSRLTESEIPSMRVFVEMLEDKERIAMRHCFEKKVLECLVTRSIIRTVFQRELEELRRLDDPAHVECELPRDVPRKLGHERPVSQQQLRELQVKLLQQPEDWLSSHDIRQLLMAAQESCSEEVNDESGSGLTTHRSADAAAGLGLASGAASGAAGLGLRPTASPESGTTKTISLGRATVVAPVKAAVVTPTLSLGSFVPKGALEKALLDGSATMLMEAAGGHLEGFVRRSSLLTLLEEAPSDSASLTLTSPFERIDSHVGRV